MGVLKRLLAFLPILAVIIALTPSPAHAQYEAARGWCENGLVNVITSGLTSANVVQGSYPQCTVTVFVHGAGLATIYSDANHTTPLANPFTAATNGSWLFYATDGRYDVENTGGPALFTMTPFTYLDILLNTGGGGGGGVTSLNSLTGAITITAGSGINVTTSGSSIQISNTGGGGGGCSPTGGNTAVQTNHPNGVCYGSQDFTWDDTTSANNLTAGDGTNVLSTDIASRKQQLLAFGSENLLFGENVAAIGLGNTLGSSTQVFFDVYATGNGNNVGASGTAGEDDAECYLQGLDNSVLEGNCDAFISGESNVISGVTANQAIDNTFINGEANLVEGLSGHYDIDTNFQVGVSNVISSSTTGAALGNMGDIWQIGGSNFATITAGAGATLANIAQLGNANSATLSSGDISELLQAGYNNTFSGSGGPAGEYGENLTETECTDCFLYGENGSISTDSEVGIGLSATPELLITPGFVEDTGLTASKCVATDSSKRFVSASGVCGGAPPSGSTTQVQFNNAGAFGADSQFTWNSSTHAGVMGPPNSVFDFPLSVGFGNTLNVNGENVPGTEIVAAVTGETTGTGSIQGLEVQIASAGSGSIVLLDGGEVNVYATASSSPTQMTGFIGGTETLSSGTVGTMFGVAGGIGVDASAGAVTEADDLVSGTLSHIFSGDTVTAYAGWRHKVPASVGVGGSSCVATNCYGAYLENMGTLSNEWSIYSAGGKSYHAGTFTFGADIVPAVVNTSNLGTALLPWKSLKIGPAANDTISLQATNVTANRTIEAADVSGVLAVITGTPTTTADCASIVFSSATTYHIVDAGVGPCSGSSGTTAALSAITAASGSNTIANADNDQEWQWAMTTNSTSAFTFDETTAAAGTGQILVNIHTKATSTAIPFQVTAVGTSNGIDVTAAGLLHAIGSGGINATEYKGGNASGTGSCGVAFVTAVNDAAAPTCTGTVSTAGAIIYYNGSAWVGLAGNASGTQWLQETSSGVPSWTTPPGGGNVSTTGSPATNSLAQFTGPTTIQGLATVGGGTNPLMVTLTSPAQGDYACQNGASVWVNCTPSVTPNGRVCSGYTVLSSDRGKPIFCSDAGAAAVTLPQAGTGGFVSFYFCIRASGAGTVTVTPTTSTVNGSATLAISTKNYACFYTDNTNYLANTATGF